MPQAKPTTSRDEFPAAIKRELMIRAGGRCSKPTCRRLTIGPVRTNAAKGQINGVAAHIHAASAGGPRYDSVQSREARASAENGIWLCAQCANDIDKNNGDDFPADQLRMWKLIAERSAAEHLYRGSKEVLDNCVGSLIFINVPRIVQRSTLQAGLEPFPSDFIQGIPSGRYIYDDLLQLRRSIRSQGFVGLDWTEASSLLDDVAGAVVRFEGVFFTKNGVTNANNRYSPYTGDLKRGPLVYSKAGDLRLVLPYDPRFLTTNTAVVEMRAGRVRLGGFAQIKYKDGSDVIASPYFIGLASTPEGRALQEALASHSNW